MTIFIAGPPTNDLDSYSGLLICLAEWLERSGLANRIPDFVRMAEARFRDVLVMPDMEKQVTLLPAATVPLPGDFDSIRALGITGYPAMDQLSPADFGALPIDPNDLTYTGRPSKFCINAGQFQFWPVPDKAYSASLTYRADLPALTLDNQTNWLLERRPDLYLYASLLHAEFYGWNDSRLPTIKAAVDEALGETTMAGVRRRYGSGPLTMKPATSERLGLRW
jgi:hypothetical protein